MVKNFELSEVIDCIIFLFRLKRHHHHRYTRNYISQIGKNLQVLFVWHFHDTFSNEGIYGCELSHISTVRTHKKKFFLRN